MMRDESGFTLVELLVSLALLSLMAIYALNALTINSQMKSVADEVGRKAEIAAVLRQFHDEIASLTPVYAQGGNGQPMLLFEGKRNAISYVASADGTRETGGLYRVTWSVDKDQQLVLQRALLRVEPTTSTSLVVLKDIADITLFYDGAETWTEQNTLPKSIKLLIAKMGDNSQKSETIALIASGQ
jgi:prepilin-type N-terminal cleavage/methylation domain-containing protein